MSLNLSPVPQFGKVTIHQDAISHKLGEGKGLEVESAFKPFVEADLFDEPIPSEAGYLDVVVDSDDSGYFIRFPGSARRLRLPAETSPPEVVARTLGIYHATAREMIRSYTARRHAEDLRQAAHRPRVSSGSGWLG